MTSQHNLTDDVVIIGGGFSGLSIAALLAAEGIPVTLLEAADLGMHASTVNQGWLYSGAWFAPRQLELAKACYESWRRTIAFCPDCLEPGHTGMLYAMTSDAETSRWTKAWDTAGIPWKAAPTATLASVMPQASDRFEQVFQLPDRSMRPRVLLQHLASVAKAKGARIHTHARVSRLNREDRQVTSVTTGRDEDIRCSMVIIATGASESDLSQYLVCQGPCTTSLYTRVTLQTHLISTPQLTYQPFCLPDLEGFNHLPHANRGDQRVSVFGMNRWNALSPLETSESSDSEFAVIRERIARCFPQADLSGDEVCSWSGTTVQAMHVDQVEPGVVPLPTVIDHALEEPCLENLLSVYPGRATLWSQLAADAAQVVVSRIKPEQSSVAQPPWN